MQRIQKKVLFEAAFRDQGYSPFIAEKMAENWLEAQKPDVIDRGPRWDLMKLFVRLANTDLRNLRAGDLLNLQEDFIKSFSMPFLTKLKYAPPTVDEFETLQKPLAKHLCELMNEGTTTIGPFSSTIIATRQTVKISKSEKTVIFHSTSSPSEPEKFLIHEFAKLLEKYGELLSKCPHCGLIFLQLRKNAIYCDRKCQRVAVMRKIRSMQIRVGGIRKKQKRSRQGS